MELINVTLLFIDLVISNNKFNCCLIIYCVSANYALIFTFLTSEIKTILYQNILLQESLHWEIAFSTVKGSTNGGVRNFQMKYLESSSRLYAGYFLNAGKEYLSFYLC